MRHRFFTFVSALSLMLCLATTVEWVRSRGNTEMLFWNSAHWMSNTGVDQKSLTIASGYGQLMLGGGIFHETIESQDREEIRASHAVSPEGRTVRYWRMQQVISIYPPERAQAQIEWHGLYVDAKWGPYRIPGPGPGRASSGSRHSLVLIIPAWGLVAVTAIPPAAWMLLRWRIRARRTTGHCLACGYDLTGNTSGVCPECGTPVELKSKATT